MITPARHRRITVVVLLATVLVVALVWVVSCAAARAMSGSSVRALEGDGAAAAGAQSVFGITGSAVVPVRPGTSSPIDVEIHNGRGDDLDVHDLVVTVISIDAPFATAELPCTKDDFTIAQTTEHIPAPAHRAVSLSGLGWDETRWPQLKMLDTASNQNGCVGASLELGFTAAGGERS